GVPESVRHHPAVFATLTAPSFGATHTRVTNPATGQVKPCRIRRKAELCPHGRLMSCRQRHSENAPCLGRPLCMDCYDYSHHVVWHSWAGELWRYTSQKLNRALGKLGKHHNIKLRASYGKVGEYQRRGVIHFHALIRIDQVDPDHPDEIIAPPPAITADLLTALLAHTVTSVGLDTPPYPGTEHTWPIQWGTQTDIRPVTGMGAGTINAEAVAAYLAKYATKATEPSGLPVIPRLNGETAHHYATPETHIGRIIAHAWQLGDTPAHIHAAHREWIANHPHDARQDTTEDPAPLHTWKTTYGRLRRWAHMLGFGGHFSTKSRHYSTTHKQLRAQRREHRTTHRAANRRRWDNHECNDDTTLIITELALAGVGWHTSADAQLATDAAARAREQRQAAKDYRLTAS
ncbi:MAG: replication initiator, partial [Steroidobacteraceae bacterium]